MRLPQEEILNYFISGLNHGIRRELAIQNPTTISQTIKLAKLIESKVKDSKPKAKRNFTQPMNHTSQTLTTRLPSNPI